MKTMTILFCAVLCYILSGCHTHTHTTEVRHEPLPPQKTYQPPPKHEPVREEIIEERTTTRVVDEYEKVEGSPSRSSSNPRKTYSEEEYDDGSVRERVIYEDTVVD